MPNLMSSENIYNTSVCYRNNYPSLCGDRVNIIDEELALDRTYDRGFHLGWGGVVAHQ